MSPPRRAPHVQWKINLDATLAARVENALWDPIHGKPRYAERSRVISELLEEWLTRQSGGVVEPVHPLPQSPSR